jgi:hypothetical protein
MRIALVRDSRALEPRNQELILPERLLAGGCGRRSNSKQTSDQMLHPAAYSPGTMR